MFHLEYPRSVGFLAWDELGCLARSLGFPVDLFKTHITEEIAAEENGLPHKELCRLLDYNILSQALHLSHNNHTDDWNMCCIRRAVSILNHKALTFKELNNARIAYSAYEASDMKGMVIDERIILRTLKMCDKTISPMKLVHRIKHSQDTFEEPGRMQLYEFLDMILWANGYENYAPDERCGHFEMEDELFKLVDFERLLSHHDQRLADKLDAQYLREEWDFGREKYNKRIKFRDQTVICGDSRAERARTQKQTFRGLRSELGSSQKMVYCTRNGYVRERPLTAPNLTRYTWNEAEAARRKSIQALRTAHNRMREFIHKAATRDDGMEHHENFGVDTSDKPIAAEYARCEPEKVVTEADVRQMDEKWQQLMFDIETEKGRYEINRDDEMEHYIPGYRERMEDKLEPEPAMPALKLKWKAQRTAAQHDSVVNNLAYPVRRIPPTHARRCDARFRGWYAVRSKAGPHYILITPHFEDSFKRHLFKKLSRMSERELKKIHREFLHRYTESQQIDARPMTAPAVITVNKKDSQRPRRNKASASSGYSSMDDHDQQRLNKSLSENESHRNQEMKENEKEAGAGDIQDARLKLFKELSDWGTETDDGCLSMDSGETPFQEKTRDFPVGMKNKKRQKHSEQRCKSAFTQSDDGTDDIQTGKPTEQLRSKSAKVKASQVETSTPMPYMEHSEPRVVSVGSIGKISLLESITESRYWEDMYGKELAESLSKGQCSHRDLSLSSSSESDTCEEEEDIVHSKQKPLRKRSKSNRSKRGEAGDAFLAMPLNQGEQPLQRKLSNNEDIFMENLGLRPRRKRHSRGSVSSAKSHKAQKPRKSSKIPHMKQEEISPAVNSNLKNFDSEKGYSKMNKQNMGPTSDSNSQLDEKENIDNNDIKDKVLNNVENDKIVKRESTLSESSSRSSSSKYGRLAQRLGNDISNRMSKRLSSA